MTRNRRSHNIARLAAVAALAAAGCTGLRKEPAPPPATTAIENASVAAGPTTRPSQGEAASTTGLAQTRPAILAVVGGVAITQTRVDDLLRKGRADAVLDVLIEYEAIRSYAERQGVRIDEEEVNRELEEAIDLIGRSPAVEAIAGPLQGKARRDALADYLRTEYRRAKGVSLDEFMVTLRRNAYLRKLATQELRFDEPEVQAEFERMFGPKAVVRHILLRNLREAQKAKDRLAKGEPFESVAEEMSADVATKAAGGLTRPIAVSDETWPESFRQACFAMKPGEVSKIVPSPMGFHIIRLERLIPRTQVDADLVRQQVEESLRKRRVFEKMDEKRREIMDLADVQINDPALAKQYTAAHPDRRLRRP